MPSLAHALRFRAVLFLALAALGLVLATPATAEAKPAPHARSHAHEPARASRGKRVVKHPWAKKHVAARPHARPHKRR